MKINTIRGIEILDSRGRPTIKVYCGLSDGAIGEASIPAGASTGDSEARELRDGDPERFHGLGCLKAVRIIKDKINPEFLGMPVISQFDFDQRLLDLDGTKDKANLGANTMLALSIAYARACAKSYRLELYSYFASLVGIKPNLLPRLAINLFSGGIHAGNQVPVQDVMIIPLRKGSTITSLELAFRIYSEAVDLVFKQYGMRHLTADEGGLAPPFADVTEMLNTTVEVINLARSEPGVDVAMGVDLAASQFFKSNKYYFDGKSLSGTEMVDQMKSWIHDYPIISLEDGLSQEDWNGWKELNKAIGTRCQIVGDDLLCTQTDRMQKARDYDAVNTLLLKANQAGTLLDAAQALQLARQYKWRVIMSARSGETEDNWLSDLAVGWGADQIKIGSINQSDRLTKYNRLLEIEAETGWPVWEWALEESNL